MRTNKKSLRVIAIFLLLNTINYIFFPVYSLALTAGPTSPEASSFEPVDTTDMVNLLTGDFTYNIPLLEVPGPAGGYPVTLAYHAGIQPNQDASWVGLGWSLNPGAINRMVNGYADDHENVQNVDRAFWEGGVTTVDTYGISYGIANGATVSMGLSFGNDTYKGTATGTYMGGEVGLNYGPFSLGAFTEIGSSPFNGGYGSTGLNLGVGAAQANSLNLGAGVGLNMNSSNGLEVGAGAGVSWNRDNKIGGSLLGASISTGGTKPSLSMGGGAIRVHNSRAGVISTTSKSWKVDIPVYAGINIRLGHDYQRYWMDETANVYTSGALFYPKNNGMASSYFDDHAYDTYDLLDIDLDIVDHESGERVLGGSFPDYDRYTVVAQGIGGNIQPYHFQQNLYRQNKKDVDTPIVKHYSLDNTDKPVEFRFVNDFSNRFEYQPDAFGLENEKPLSFKFNEEIKTGEMGDEGYVNNHLDGSKHVKYFTNKQILNGEAGSHGFIENQAAGFIRDNNTQIGGFIMTNPSGVNYHFTLPAYSKEEYIKSENTIDYKKEKGDTYNELTKKEKYAYTWFLTAVTGPDYTDRNSNGRLDEADFGYWVSFEYGKWADSYIWRNPSEGYNMDIDGKFRNFSTGTKEIYYLDAISTASHTALFIKEIRKDGKGVRHPRYGGFNPQKCFNDFFPVSVLKLSEIMLLKNENLSRDLLNEIRASSGDFNFSFVHTCDGHPNCHPCGRETCCETPRVDFTTSANHLSSNVIETGDVGRLNSLNPRSLKVIDFVTDYSLCKGTSNSMDNDKLYTADPIIELDGKLTLKELHFLGNGGASFMPPTTFTYSKNPSYNKDTYDIWGFYKSDYKEMFNENLARSVSKKSAEDVDAWSLSHIATATGADINIEYESDSYDNPELYKSYMLNISELTPTQEGKIEVRFYNLPDNLNNIFTLSSTISLKGLLAFPHSDEFRTDNGGSCDGFRHTFESEIVQTNEGDIEILNIYEQFLEIRDMDLYETLVKIKPDRVFRRYHEPLCGDVEIRKINFHSPVFIGGNLYSKDNFKHYGGGLRVKSINIGFSNSIRSTNYFYESESQKSYGTTSFEPYGLDKEILSFPDSDYSEEYLEKEAETLYRKELYKGFFRTLGISREVPGPGVMYEYVTVRETNGKIELPNYTTYHFETFKKGMVDIESSEGVRSESVNDSYDNISFKHKNTRKLALKNYSSRMGNLKSVTVYNKNGSPVNETIYLYSNDGFESFEQNKTGYEDWLRANVNNQGVIEETFSNARFVRYKAYKPLPYNDYTPTDNEYHLLGIISKKETFPSIPVGQFTKNYLTGLTSSSENIAFDYYSGNVTKTLTTDSYGNRYLSVSEPAYKRYPAMGLKVKDANNKHMLTQDAATYLYKVDNENDLNPTGLLTASVQTWSNTTPVLKMESQPEVWRKEAAYTWDGQKDLKPDGTYDYDDFILHPFNWANPSGSTNWERLNQITLYDHFSHALEAVDMNGNKAATRMDPKQHKVIASVANAAYNETAFTGAEMLSGNAEHEGGVSRGGGTVSTAHAHTGHYSLMVTPGQTGFNFTLDEEKADLSKKYRASVWVYLPGEVESEKEIEKAELFYSVGGQEIKKAAPKLKKSQSKSWYLLNLDIDASSGGDIYIGCRNNASRGIYMDDFRVHPLDASMSSYVYDEHTDELTYILDPNNFYTRYKYDEAGRVISISRERLNFDFGEGTESFKADQVLKEVTYHPKEKTE